MKKTFGLSLALAFAMVFGQAAHASEYNLKQLDVLKTCQSEVQRKNGELALDYLQAFLWWNAKDQMKMLHPDFISWHAALSGLLAARPEFQGKVPFAMGQWTKKTHVQTLAFLAYNNDLEKYFVTPERVDCVGDDSVVLVTNFTGVQIRRDPKTNCVTHGVPFGSRTHLSFQFKDYVAKPGAPVQSLIYRGYSSLDDLASAKVREEMAKIVGGPANMAPNPANCKSYEQILKEFQAQLN